MEPTLLLTLGGILLLLGFSGFFSGSETALTAASEARIHRLAKGGDTRAVRVEHLISRRDRLIGAILLGNNLVNILASALATSFFIDLVGETGVVYATLVMTALVLIFAEVLPKTYAIANPVRMALAVSGGILFVTRLFSPVVNLVERIVRGTLMIFGVDLHGRASALSGYELIRGTIDFQASEGGIRKVHRDMLGSILDLDEITVEEVMIHRKNMTLLDVNDSTEKIVTQVVRAPFTRLPVFETHPENIVGIVHSKDMLRAFRRAGGDSSKVDMQKLMTEPWFVPETTTLREQLNAFLNRRSHFALVVDEYGALMGLITLEDILEEIVGEISDEFDRPPAGIEELDDGWVQVDGTITIRDLNRQFDWELPDEEATTIAGLVIYEAEEIPVVGDHFNFGGFEYEITGRHQNQITGIKMRPIIDESAIEMADDGIADGAGAGEAEGPESKTGPGPKTDDGTTK